MKHCVLNKQGKFGLATFVHYTDIVIFVLGHFILTHTVYVAVMADCPHTIGVEFGTRYVHYCIFFISFCSSLYLADGTVSSDFDFPFIYGNQNILFGFLFLFLFADYIG